MRGNERLPHITSPRVCIRAALHSTRPTRRLQQLVVASGVTPIYTDDRRGQLQVRAAAHGTARCIAPRNPVRRSLQCLQRSRAVGTSAWATLERPHVPALSSSSPRHPDRRQHEDREERDICRVPEQVVSDASQVKRAHRAPRTTYTDRSRQTNPPGTHMLASTTAFGLPTQGHDNIHAAGRTSRSIMRPLTHPYSQMTSVCNMTGTHSEQSTAASSAPSLECVRRIALGLLSCAQQCHMSYFVVFLLCSLNENKMYFNTMKCYNGHKTAI